MQDVYKELNIKIREKKMIVFDNMIANMIENKKN